MLKEFTVPLGFIEVQLGHFSQMSPRDWSTNPGDVKYQSDRQYKRPDWYFTSPGLSVISCNDISREEFEGEGKTDCL